MTGIMLGHIYNYELAYRIIFNIRTFIPRYKSIGIELLRKIQKF